MLWFRKRYDFYGMLLAQAQMSEEACRQLEAYLQHPTPELGEQVDRTETEADEMRRQLIDALNRTFVTPIDREDIFALSRAIDDMVDYANTTVKEMGLFGAETNDHLKKMGAALYQAAQELTRAVRLLPQLSSEVSAHLIKVKKTENLVEHLYRESLAVLFKTADVMTILKLREIYRHLSNAADRGDEAADILSDILVKNT